VAVKVTDCPVREGLTDEMVVVVVPVDALAATTSEPVGENDAVVAQPPPAVVETVTVKVVVPAGVAPVVEIVRTDVVAAFVTVVGLKTPVAPAGSPLTDNAFVVQVPEPPAAQVLVIV